MLQRRELRRAHGLHRARDGQRPQALRIRRLTGDERAAAAEVFADSLDLDRIRVVEGSPLALGRYARSIPGSIHIDAGTSQRRGYHALLIHELTHQWQYQHGVALWRVAWSALRRRYDYGGAERLVAALERGVRFLDFDPEQQAEIVRDHFVRQRRGMDTAPWTPFIEEVRGGRPYRSSR